MGTQLKFDLFLCFFERVLVAALGAIREAMGWKVPPKCSQMVPNRCHFVARVDFCKQLFHYCNSITFEVLVVPGEDLETFSETKADKKLSGEV